MKTLVCLLSDQHVPNLLSVHHFLPERLVLVETAGMKKRDVAGHFLKALRFGGLEYGNRVEIVPVSAEDSLPAMRATLEGVWNSSPSVDWIANVTGGTKPMSIAAYAFFKERGARVIYTNVAKPAEFLDIDVETKEQSRYRPGVNEFLAGYGFEFLKSDKKITEAQDRGLKWWECSRQIARGASTHSLLPLPDDLRSRARRDGYVLSPGDLMPVSDEAKSAIVASFQLDPVELHGNIDEYAAKFLTGEWLDVFFWGLISRNADQLNCWDVRLGQQVGRTGVSNELDVAFMHEYGFEVIECKSGAQDHDKGADILYKVEAVRRQFGAIRVRSYLATTATNIFSSQGSIKDQIRNRAEIYNCRIITSSEIQRLADHPDDVAYVRQVLFDR